MTREELNNHIWRVKDKYFFYGKEFAAYDIDREAGTITLSPLGNPCEVFAIADCDRVTVIPDPAPSPESLTKEFDKCMGDRQKLADLWREAMNHKTSYSLVELATISRSLASHLPEDSEWRERLLSWAKGIDKLEEQTNELEKSLELK